MAINFHKTDVIGTILGLLILAAAFVLTSDAFAQSSSQGATVGSAETTMTQSVVRDQLNAFKSGDIPRAYSHAAPNVKKIFPTQNSFSTMVERGYSPIWQSDSFVFGRNVLINNEIYQEVIITDPKGGQWQAVYTLKQQEDGSWKITGVKLDPYKGATT